VSFTVRGEAAANTALQRLRQNFRRGVLGGGYAATAIVVRTAQNGILNGSKSGRVYTTFFRTGKNGGVFPVGSRPAHHASAPGEYSANDTGALVSSIGGSNSFLQMRVWARAPHAGFQEYGTSRFAPRPNIANAVRDSDTQVTAVLGQYVWRNINQ
jgi:hypothetical protein